jgi:hypothetical protein
MARYGGGDVVRVAQAPHVQMPVWPGLSASRGNSLSSAATDALWFYTSTIRYGFPVF